MSPETAISLLCKLPRTGWLIRGVERPETVADHTFGTMLLAMLWRDHGHEDAHNPLSMGLIHDLAEISLGDITPRTKALVVEALGYSRFADLETNHLTTLFGRLPVTSREYLTEVWQELCSEETNTSRTAHILDVLEMLSQAYEYEKTGQRKLDEFWRFIPNCEPDPFAFELANTINRKRIFLRVSDSTPYQHFEASYHHSGREFAELQPQTVIPPPTYRDRIVKRHFKKSFHYSQDLTGAPLEILDVGCGLGYFSWIFINAKDSQVHVTGVDISPYLLNEATKLWPKQKFSTLPAMDIGWYWDLESQSRDILLLGEVLEHVFDPWFVLMEAFRVLKYNGLLYVSVPNSFHRDKLDRMTQERKIECRFREEHIRYFGPEQLVELVNETGFVVEEFWGLRRGWKSGFCLTKKILSKPEEPSHYRNADDAWSLLLCCRKKNPKEIKETGVTLPPGRFGDRVTLDTRVARHKLTRERAQIHKFIEELNKAKLLRVDLTDRHSETIAQQTYRLAFLACCAALELGMDSEKAIESVILQGMVESHLAEVPPNVRAAFKEDTRRKALDSVINPLPSSLREKYASNYEKLLLDTPEGALAKYLLLRDYCRRGAVPESAMEDIVEHKRYEATVSMLA